LLDIGALFAIVGQFFGRIGNFINGDVIGDYECAERLRFAVEKGLGMLQK
jgi:prolipoprotein diacylglyceryltransferase